MTQKNDAKRIAAQAVPDFDDATTDVNYCGDSNPMHTLNVYRPRGAQGKLPVILDIHGGGWYYGDKELNSYYCRSLTRHGFAVVDISYRLVPETDIVGQVQDVFAAINYTAAHADEFSLDVDRFFIAGDSAGGHLCGMAANIVKSQPLQQFYGVSCDVDIKGAGLICPAADPLKIIPAPKGLLKFYFNPVFGKGYLKTKPPVSFIETLQKDVCPCFFISAYGDFLKGNTKKAYEAVKAQGTKTQLAFLDKPLVKGHKLTHVFNVLFWDWQESELVNKQMCEFFKSI